MDEAERYHRISLKYALSSKDDNAIAYAYLRYGALQAIRRNNCMEGIRCVEAANELFTKYHDVEGMCWSLRTLGNVYHKCGDYDKAKDAWVRLADAQDSLFSKQVADKTVEYRILYETEKKEKENALKDKQIEKEREMARNQVVYFLIAIVGIIAMFSMLYYRYRYQKKVETERSIAEEQLKRFKAVIEAEEKERGRIAEELHDGVGHLLSSAKLNASAIEDVSGDNKKLVERTMNIIDEALAEARNISHNLMPAVLAELGLAAAIKQLARKITQTGKLKVVLHNEDNIPVLAQAAAVALYRIIQEVMNNALKHSGADTIIIYFTQVGTMVKVTVEDNGRGFDVNKVMNGDGLGWKNIFSRAQMLNGNVVVNSTPGAGSTVTITFES
jgi:signal transduction histidine kinase